MTPYIYTDKNGNDAAVNPEQIKTVTVVDGKTIVETINGSITEIPETYDEFQQILKDARKYQRSAK